MNIICSTNEFDVCQDKRKNTIFTITINKNNNYQYDLLKPLFNSIIKTKLINNSTIVTQTDKKERYF